MFPNGRCRRWRPGRSGSIHYNPRHALGAQCHGLKRRDAGLRVANQNRAVQARRQRRKGRHGRVRRRSDSIQSGTICSRIPSASSGNCRPGKTRRYSGPNQKSSMPLRATWQRPVVVDPERPCRASRARSPTDRAAELPRDALVNDVDAAAPGQRNHPIPCDRLASFPMFFPVRQHP